MYPNNTGEPDQVKAETQSDTPSHPKTGETPTPFYGVIPRSVLADPRLSDRAIRLYAVLDSRCRNISQRVKMETLMDDLGGVSADTIQRALKELTLLGLVATKRTGRATSYRVFNEVRAHAQAKKELAKLEPSYRTIAGSDTADLRVLQRSNSLGIKSKSKGAEEPPLVEVSSSSAETSPAVSAKPLNKIKEQELNYIRAFRDNLEAIDPTLYFDTNSMKAKTGTALVKAKAEGLSANDLATKCHLWLEARKQERLVINPIGFLISAIPAIVDGEPVGTAIVNKAPTYPSVAEVMAQVACECGNLVKRVSEGVWTGCRRCTPNDPKWQKVGVIEGLERQWRHIQDPHYSERKEAIPQEIKELASKLGRSV